MSERYIQIAIKGETKNRIKALKGVLTYTEYLDRLIVGETKN